MHAVHVCPCVKLALSSEEVVGVGMRANAPELG